MHRIFQMSFLRHMRSLAIVAAVALAACAAHAQSTSGNINGTVLDPTGAFIPGAALLVGGIIVFATAPRSAKSPPSVGFVVAPAARGGAVLTVTGEM